VYEYTIIHRAGVVFYVQTLFDQAIKGIEIEEGKPLTCLISQRQALAWFGCVAINDLIEQLQYLFVLNDSPQFLLKNRLIDTDKKLANIALQEVAFGAIISVMPAQKPGQTIERKMCAFIFSASGVVMYQSPLEDRFQERITEAMLNHAVSVVQSVDIPEFWLFHHEVIIRPRFVCPVLELLLQMAEIARQIHLEADNLSSVTLSAPGALMGFVEILKIT
jgi:hypothetical protein